MPQVPWYTIAPLSKEGAIDTAVALPFGLGGGVTLAAPPAEYRDPAVTSWIEKCHGAERGFQKSRVAFIARYSAEAMSEPDPDWRGVTSRSKQDRALDAIRFGNIAVWLARPSAVGFEFFLHISVEETGEVSVRQSGTYSKVRTHADYDGGVVGLSDLGKARFLSEALVALPRPGVLSTAARMLWFALTEETWDTRFILLWVALEALFGPEDSYTKRVSTEIPRRIARLFSDERRANVEAYQVVEDSYDWRSRIVHGQRIDGMTEPKSKDLVRWAERMARTAFRRVLKDSKLTATFNDPTQREAYLDHAAKGFLLPAEAECAKWPMPLEEPRGPKEPKRAGLAKK